MCRCQSRPCRAYDFKHKMLLTYLLTPWCRVLLEQLTGLQLVKKFPASHGTPRFITALTSFRQLSLSWASPIQSIYPHPTSWRSFLILSTHLRLGLPTGLLPSGFPTKNLYTPSPHPYAPHAQPLSFFSILSPAQYLVRSTNHLAPRYAFPSKMFHEQNTAKFQINFLQNVRESLNIFLVWLFLLFLSVVFNVCFQIFMCKQHLYFSFSVVRKGRRRIELYVNLLSL